MNIPIDDSAQQLERLVEGSLSEPDRAELLTRLEAEPGGWRRCALAFLEDQALRAALATFEVAAVSRAIAPPRAESPRAGVRAYRGLAWAATALLAFGAGLLTARPGLLVPSIPDSSSSVPPALAEADPGPPAAPNPAQAAPQLTALAPPHTASRGPLSRNQLSRLARDGFAVEIRPGIAGVGRPGANPLAVPVAELQLRFIGDRIY